MAEIDERRPQARRPRWTTLETPARALVWLLIALAVLEIYHQAEFIVVHVFGVLLLFVFGAFIALLLTPLVDQMQKVPPFNVHRAIASLTLYAIFFAAVAAIVALLTPHLIAEARQLPQLFKQVQDALNSRGVHVSLPTSIQNIGVSAVGSALGLFTSIITVIVDIVLIVVISIYLLIQGRDLLATVRLMFPSQERRVDFVLTAVGATFASYVRGQLIMSTVMGLYTGISMTLIGVHYAAVLGVAAFFLEALPMIGAPTVMASAVIVALFQHPVLALWAGVVGVVGHIIESYVLVPRIMGRVVRIHPLAAMAALLVGAELAGIMGALFAVPLAAVGNILLGAVYRARRGVTALSTAQGGEVTPDTLPRFGEEIARADDIVETESREESKPSVKEPSKAAESLS